MDAVGALPRGLPHDALVDEVRRAVGGLADGARVVVGASGGPDSAALLLLLASARPDLHVTAVHVRHGLRPDDEDVTAFGAQVAAAAGAGGRAGDASVGAGAVVEAGIVEAGVVEAGVVEAGVVEAGVVEARVVEVEVVEVGDGLEAAARVARHAALGEVAREVGAAAILLGHTADDQAETVLLRLARGSGARGLAGMAPWRPFDASDVGQASGAGLASAAVLLGRPMLRLRREDVRGVAGAAGVPVATDPSNRDPRFARSHLRATVLPELGVHAGDPVGALARAADLLREDADALDGWAASVVASAAVPFGPVVSLPEAALLVLPVAVRRRVVRAVTSMFGLAVDAAAVGAVLALEPGQAWDAGGLGATRGGGWLALAPSPVPADAPRVTIVESFAAAPPPTSPAPPTSSTSPTPPGGRPDRSSLTIDAALRERFEVRTRLPGDRIRTAGGTRSVQDLFVDAGVPRLVRDLVPLLVDPSRDAGGSVVWVPGLDADPDVVAAGRQRPAVTLCLGPG